MIRRLADNSEDDNLTFSGVRIEFEDLYRALVFLTCVYASGRVASFARLPSLVGEILCGILLGPPLADFIPNAEAWVLLGEIG